MLTKTLIVTILIVLSWNSFKLSENNTLLRQKLLSNQEIMQQQIIDFKKSIQEELSKTQSENTKSLNQNEASSKNKKIVKSLSKNISSMLEEIKQLQEKQNITEALIKLDSLKAELWKLKNNESQEIVLSIISSIDIIKDKWSKKEITYSLNTLEEKTKILTSSEEL